MKTGSEKTAEQSHWSLNQVFFPPDFPRFLCSQHRHPGRAALGAPLQRLTYACDPGGSQSVCSGHCVHFPYGCAFPLTRAEVRPETDHVHGCEGCRARTCSQGPMGPPTPLWHLLLSPGTLSKPDSRPCPCVLDSREEGVCFTRV